jgi:AIPR protein
MHETRDLFDFMIDRIRDVQNRTATQDYHAFGRWFAQLYFPEPKEISTWDGSGDGKADVVFKTEEDGELRYHILNTKFTKKFDTIAPPKFYDEITTLWQAFANRDSRPGYLKRVAEQLRPKFKPLFDRYDNGKLDLWFATNHRRNNTQVEALKSCPVRLFHMEDILGFMADYIEDAMPMTRPMTLSGIGGVLTTDPIETEVPISVVFARLTDFIKYMEGDPFQLLFARNVRLRLRGSAVNTDIANTFRKSPKDFVFSNNGITIICDDIHHSPPTRELVVDNPRVVNGSQTLHSVRDVDQQSPTARVMVRLIKIPRPELSDLRALAERRRGIIRSISLRSNFQNPIKKWNLRANDDFQHELSRYFRDKKLFYERRQNEWRDRKRQMKELNVQRGPDIRIVTQLIASYYWQRKSMGPAVAKARLGELFEDDTYKTIVQTSPELAYQMFRFWGLIEEAIRHWAEERQYVKALRRHIGFALFSLFARCSDEVGAKWGKREFTESLEAEWKNDPRPFYIAAKRGIDHILSFYKKQQKISRKREGQALTLNNFFKSQTYMKEVLSARLPPGMTKDLKAYLNAS